jgi:hypothetical protein
VIVERHTRAGGGDENDQQNNQQDNAGGDRAAEGLEDRTHGFLLFCLWGRAEKV